MESFQAFAETVLIPAQLTFALLGMGATLTLRDFSRVLRDPVGLAVGFVLQLIVVPVIAATLIAAFDMGPGWAVGLLLVAVVPGGAMSNLFTYLAKGNTPLSISLTVAATAGCIVTVPLLLRLLAPSYLPADFEFPVARIVRDICLFLLVPLCVGMVARAKLSEERSKWISTWSIRMTLVLLGAIVVSSLGSGRIKVWEYGWVPPARVVGFGLALAIGIPHLCRLLRRRDPDTVAIGVEVCVRNVGVGLLMFPFFFPGQPEQAHVLFTCLFYSGLSAFLAVPLILLHRAGRSPVVGRRRWPAPAADQPPSRGSERI